MFIDGRYYNIVLFCLFSYIYILIVIDIYILDLIFKSKFTSTWNVPVLWVFDTLLALFLFCWLIESFSWTSSTLLSPLTLLERILWMQYYRGLLFTFINLYLRYHSQSLYIWIDYSSEFTGYIYAHGNCKNNKTKNAYKYNYTVTHLWAKRFHDIIVNSI